MSLVENNLICKCFLTENYFVRQINRHVSFVGRQEFIATYSAHLPNICDEKVLEDIINELEAEQQRRLSNGVRSQERQLSIRKNYTPLHPHVYRLQDDFLLPEFKNLADLCLTKTISSSELVSYLECIKGADRVYRIPIFTHEFCRDLTEEIVNFERSDLPKSRPNTMNHYGIILEELLDFDEGVVKPLREQFLSPISRTLYPECVDADLDSHKAFVVSYRIGQDLDLDYHYDNAEVTCNISIVDNYKGGDLYFGGMKSESRRDSYARCLHRMGYGVLHRGQHLHGAMELEEGERQNLIIWMRSSGVRNTLCPMCGLEPSLMKSDGRGDGFTMKEMNVCTTL